MTCSEQPLCAYLCAWSLSGKQTRKVYHRIRNRKQARIGVSLRRELDVAMPHDLHRNTR
jgi:hypothetical protein